jgi:hypothetical protein
VPATPIPGQCQAILANQPPRPSAEARIQLPLQEIDLHIPMTLEKNSTIELKSYPNRILKLPPSTQILTPAPPTPRPIDREESLQSLLKLLLPLMRSSASSLQSTERALLLLPDKTRKQTAARLLIDAMVEISQLKLNFSFDIIYGLGTHPLMSEDDIESMVGTERLANILAMGSTLKQQTTLNPLPQNYIKIANPGNSLGSCLADRFLNTEEIRIGLPAALWDYEYIITGGDTDLHPYEGRSGSGGINKMLAIGVGCLTTVRITHTIEILSHPLTRPAEPENHFVKLIDHFAAEITANLKKHPSRLYSTPIGVSVLARKTDQPEHIWVGNQDEGRRALTKQLENERTVPLEEPIDFVITDTEKEKATDILAGARSLHFICSFDDDSNQLLAPLPAHRSAIMFNTCHELKNTNGIGNSGTFLHLKALRSFVRESIIETIKPESSAHTKQLTDEQANQLKIKILNRWQAYLRLVSEEDQFFAKLETLLINISLETKPAEKENLANILSHCLNESLNHSHGMHKDVIIGTLQNFENNGSNTALTFLRKTTRELGFKGLGEGGQRALRLLLILQNFNDLYIATDNQYVLDFIKEFSYDSMENESHTKTGDISQAPSINILGLTGISLRKHSCQEALEIALAIHKNKKIDYYSKISLAFIQQPVILMRSTDLSIKKP